MPDRVPHRRRRASWVGAALALLTVGCAGEPESASLRFDQDRGVVQALLDQQATLYPGALCKLRLLERR